MENNRREFKEVYRGRVTSTMTGREQLELVKEKQKLIDKKEQRLNEMKAIAYSTSSANYSTPRVQTSYKPDRREQLLATCIDLEQELLGDKLDLFIYRDKLINEIFKIHDATLINFLIYRYIRLQPLKEVARHIEASEVYTRHLNKKAVNCFEEIINNE